MNTEDVSDPVLIAQSKQGDKDAVAELFRRHYTASLNVARRILRRHEDAQDAVQVAFMMAFRRLESFRGDSSFKTWITRITVNCCLFQLREKRNRVTWVQLEGRNGEQGPDLPHSGIPTPEKSAWHGEIASAFAAALARLPKRLQKPYALFAIYEFSLEDVASSLGLSLAATKSRVYRARAGMRSSLQPVWIGRHRV
jgi:RNA polymerase sigma-70 factor (ECF subfamily)